MLAEMRRGNGIDDLLSSMTPGEVEEQQDVHVEGEHPHKEVLELYTKRLGDLGPNQINKFDIRRAVRVVDFVLRPDEIESFLLSTIPHEGHIGYAAFTGAFITRLIEKSYKEGHNNFVLRTDLCEKPLCYVGSFISGKKERPLNIKVFGSLGAECAGLAAWSNYSISGDAGYCYGSSSRNSTHYIGGDIGLLFGPDASYFTFRTPNRRTAEKIVETVVKVDNTVFYVQDDGTEEVMLEC
jgi:hypothetical protein